jgi:hypothetical protein
MILKGIDYKIDYEDYNVPVVKNSEFFRNKLIIKGNYIHDF